MGAHVSWFEIPANDPKKLSEFYKGAFGWTVEQYPGMDYFVIDTHSEGAGIKGAFTTRDMLKSPANTLYVKLLDEAMAAVKANGGRMLSERMDIPEVGAFAYAADTEGNVFGLLQPVNPS